MRPLHMLLGDPDLAGVRDRVEELPEAERKAWMAFWDEVRKARDEAMGRKGA